MELINNKFFCQIITVFITVILSSNFVSKLILKKLGCIKKAALTED